MWRMFVIRITISNIREMGIVHLLRALNAPRFLVAIPLEKFIAQIGKKLWRQDTVDNRGRVASRNRPQIGARPYELIRLREDDP